MPGFKSNMSDIQAAIGLHQLQEVDGMNERRRQLSDRYREAFADMDDKFFMQGTPDYDFVHSGHLFPICLRDASLRDDFMSFLKERSIGTTPYYTPLHLFTYYQKEFGYKKGDYPEAEYIGERIVSLPLYTALQETEQDYIIETIREFFK